MVLARFRRPKRKDPGWLSQWRAGITRAHKLITLLVYIVLSFARISPVFPIQREYWEKFYLKTLGEFFVVNEISVNRSIKLEVEAVEELHVAKASELSCIFKPNAAAYFSNVFLMTFV